MSRQKVTFHNAKYSDEVLIESIKAILDANELSAMATVRDGKSYIHTTYFVYNEFLELYFLSQPYDVHVSNVKKNPSIAVAIWSPSGEWSEHLQGLQIFGSCEEVPFLGRESISAMGLFIQRFPAFQKLVKHPGEFATGVTSRIFVVRSQSLKLLDEPRFGRRNYITLDIARSQKD